MNRIYEELFILRPDITEEEVDGIVEPLRGVVTTSGGTVDKVDKWGVRRLAYKVEKRNDGYYVLMQFTSAAPAMPSGEAPAPTPGAPMPGAPAPAAPEPRRERAERPKPAEE